MPPGPQIEKGMEADMDVNIGITENQRKPIADGLSRLLADTYTLYIKTHGFHWNVTGPMFPSLHLLFEEQYTELATAVDLIAERIRALGFPAPGSYREFSELASVKEKPGVRKALDMVQELALGHETVVQTARAVLPHAQEAGDEASLNILTDRLEAHEKNAWMLRSMLSED